MRILKISVFILLGIILVTLIVGVFSEKKYTVERKISINKSNETVFDYLKYLKNQGDFSVWVKMEPNMKKTYEGRDGEVGFVSAWVSTNEMVGEGEQEITKIEEGKLIESELRFKVPFESTSKACILTESISENSTEVTWKIIGEVSYPMNLKLFFRDMDESLGKDLSDGLTTLKEHLENDF
jgi:hypothetical protein